MPHDPDFHETAAAWLDGTGDNGTQRVLREILRDTPAAAVEFAALARTDAALQLTAVSPAERLQRARRLIQPSATARLRRFVASPAFRVAAAAVVVLAGAVWWFISRGNDSATDAVKPRLAPHIQRTEAPTLTRMTPPPDELPPADKDFARRMSRFIVPEFKATGVPLVKALDVLRKDIAAIDDTAVPDFSIAPELPDDLTVHLRLRYLPVAVILNVIAIQTGTNFKPTGKGYQITADAKAPMPGEVIQRSYAVDQLSRMPLGDWPPEFDPQAASKYFSAKSAFCLGEEPGSVRSDTDSNVRFEASRRFHKLVQQLISAGQGTPTGTWRWDVKAAEFSGTETQAKFIELAGETSGRAFTDPEFQMLMRSVSQMKGVDLMTLHSTILLPGGSATSFTGKESPDPQNAPDDWTGIRWTVAHLPIGDSEASFEFRFQIRETDGGTPDAPPLTSFSSESTGHVFDGQTMMVHNATRAEGKLLAFFVTGNAMSAVESQPQATPPDIREQLSPDGNNTPPAPPDDLPYGMPVEGNPGMVFSPYAPDKGMVDVSGLKRGTRISCPYSGKRFRVP